MIYCRKCNTELHQDDNKSYEVGIMKWFKTIQPYPFIGLLCQKHYEELLKFMEVSGIEQKLIERQSEEDLRS